MHWWHIYLLIVVSAGFISAFFTWLCRCFAVRLGFVDNPAEESHKTHSKSIPAMGGLGMLCAWLVIILIGALVYNYGQPILPKYLFKSVAKFGDVVPKLLLIVGGATGVALLGLWDDRFALSAKIKLLGQIMVAGVVAMFGVRITAFIDNGFITWVITVFWIVLLINAINFLDNMDGLAGGIVAISSLFFAITAAVQGQYFICILACSILGVSLGFLVFNYTPASIFMGDAGSHFLGFLLAITGVMSTYYTPENSQTPVPILIPVLILAVPLFDLLAVVCIRLRQGKAIYVGDNQHLSHRFTHLGLSRSQAVILVWLLSFTIAAGAVLLLWLPLLGAVIVLMQAVAILIVISIIQFYSLNKKA